MFMFFIATIGGPLAWIPILVAPAMNTQMWENPVVQQNVQSLENRGWQRIGPEEGQMACGTAGSGRMTDPETILQTINEVLL